MQTTETGFKGEELKGNIQLQNHEDYISYLETLILGLRD